MHKQVNNWKDFYNFLVPLHKRCRVLKKKYRHLFSLIICNKTLTPYIINDSFIRVIEFNKLNVDFKFVDYYPLINDMPNDNYYNKFEFNKMFINKTKQVIDI